MKSNKTANNQSIGQPNLAGLFLLGELTPDDLTLTFDLSQEYHFEPSMSRPGCPYDNAAMENFFGTLKAECLSRLRFSSRTEVEEAVAEYVQFYNFERIDMNNGLTPFEIRSKAA